MGYQALLFCADEKLVRVVTQVFTDLEFNVEPVSDPFSAVKKLMAQHYDAVVVDCENEQNASLLFKSARNSGTNQSSLALALVEGQAGVAKAYRIGANLVLTKPINVEQAKGTLRVARGLLRKNAESAGTHAVPSTVTAAPPRAVPPSSATPSGGSIKVERDTPKTVEPAASAPEPQPALPVMAASAKVDESPKVAPAPEAATRIPTAADSVPSFLEAAVAETAPQISSTVKATATQTESRKPTTFANLQGAAAAPAPAKNAPAASKLKTADKELFETNATKVQPAEFAAVPTFSALDEQQESGALGGKKFLAIAAVAVIVVGLGYFGWTKFGKASSVSQSQNAVQVPPVVPGNSGRSAVANEIAPTTPKESNTVVAKAPTSKPSASVSGAMPKISVGSESSDKPEVVTKTFSPAPIHVKSQSAHSKVQPQTQTDESAPVPDPLGVGSIKDTNLASLVSAPATLPKARLGTLKISQGVSQGLLIKKVQPSYPENAKAMRIEGAVEMEALIDKEGKITNLKVVKGQAILARAAVDAVRQWRYKPYYLDGEPVEIQTQITVNFKLPN